MRALLSRAFASPGVAVVVGRYGDSLGERLSRGEAEAVAAYLHGDAEEWLVEEHSGDAEAAPADEFVERVASRAEVPEERAPEYVPEVSGVLRGAAPPRELQDAVD